MLCIFCKVSLDDKDVPLRRQCLQWQTGSNAGKWGGRHAGLVTSGGGGYTTVKLNLPVPSDENEVKNASSGVTYCHNSAANTPGSISYLVPIIVSFQAPIHIQLLLKKTSK